jgi:hypothetical protein
MDLQMETKRDHESRERQIIRIGSGSSALVIRGGGSLRPGSCSFPSGRGESVF